jgi:hypothetical protein
MFTIDFPVLETAANNDDIADDRELCFPHRNRRNPQHDLLCLLHNTPVELM